MDYKKALLSGVCLFALACSPALATGSASAARQTEVAERGAQVMPFDLEATLHIFEKREDGGLQQVVAKDPADQTQIRLIQLHLEEEAGKFARGDFSDPARIHGHHMPGLADLMQSGGRLQADYSALANGGQIRYRTADAQLVSALHRWFDAQLADHGAHALPHPHHGHQGH